MAGLAYDALTAAGYAINVRLAAVATDYFADPAPSPFQHFWSLAVEEQFYLCWPLVLIVALRFGRARVLVGVLVAASLTYSAFELTRNAPAAYFGLPSRAWELGVGALLALLPARRMGAAIGWAGLAAIVVSAITLTDDTAFPGLAALPPVLGAAAVIAARNGPARLLGLRPLTRIGDYSYGLYLWHWPLLIVVPAALGHDVGLAGRLGLAALAVLLAAATYHFLENPVRHRTARPARGLALGLGLSATTAGLAALALAVPPTVPTGGVAPDTRAALRTAGDPPAS